MDILLVEDHVQYLDLIANKLQDTFGFNVIIAREPLAAINLMRSRTFDVIVVDVLYRALSEKYNEQRERARSSLTELEPYNISGLMVLLAARSLPSPPRALVWTSGDPNRALHIVLAHQEFRVRAFSSKESRHEILGQAIRRAADGQEWIDPTLRPFLPRHRLPPLSEVLFREVRWRAIWRALAAGSPSHKTTARMTHYEEQTIRKAMMPMADSLTVLSPHENFGRQPLNWLSRYATFHWEFFLDRAVHSLYPH
jgi:DNA-binding NarL/FixJ family response regulator